MPNLNKDQRELNENVIFDEYYNEFSYMTDDYYYSVATGGKTLYITAYHSSDTEKETMELDEPVFSLDKFKKQLKKRGIIQ